MKIIIKNRSFYWPTMFKDCDQFVKSCLQCQAHGVVPRRPPNQLHPTVPTWPFAEWGMDIVGPLPPSSRGCKYILAATDYFSRWAEALPLREVTGEIVARFVRHHIIYRYGVPSRIISDNGTPFKNQVIYKMAAKFHMDWRTSTVYNPQANGLAEAFNKTLCKLLSKLVGGHKRDWDEKMHEALWAYRTTYKTPTGCTPYSLVYGSEAVVPVEIELSSYRVAVHYGLQQEEQDEFERRYEELAALEGDRLAAYRNLQSYQAKMVRAYGKLVHERTFMKGDLVMVKKKDVMANKAKGKFAPSWVGPYVVDKVYEGGAYTVLDHNGNLAFPPLNGKHLKRYYAPEHMFQRRPPKEMEPGASTLIIK